MMKKDKTNLGDSSWILAFMAFLIMPLFLMACDEGFDAMNIDDSAITSVEPVFQLNQAIMASELNGNHIRCEGSIVKQQMRIFTGVGACGNFNVDASANVSNTIWNTGYQNQIRNLVDAERSSDPNSNVHQMIRIWKAFVFMRLTDSYGDVPFREAGLGFLEGNVFPGYDAQESIYTADDGILEELVNATAALDPNRRTDSRVMLYDGDVEQWQRLGNSLLLRGAMRLTKVNPTLAGQYVNTAVSGGLLRSNEDNAFIDHDSDFQLGIGQALNAGQAHFQYLVEDFVDYLRDNDDPRLASIAVRYPGATGPGDQNEANADRDPANQIGIPMGFDNTNIGPVAEAAGLASFMAYSQVDRTRMMDPFAPSFIVTYALQQLYLADAAQRGWINEDPAALYEEGIEAHMHQLAQYPGDTAIDQADIDVYIQDNTLEAGRELEQINTQFWIASYLIPTESWANFRRTGYPDLEPNPMQTDLGPEEDFMRRFGYPDGEKSINPNVTQGVTPDRIDTRIWWDVRD